MFVVIASYEPFALRNCKILFSQTLPAVKGKKLNHLNIFRNLTYLAPGRQIPVFAGETSSFLESLRQKKISVTVKHKMPDGSSQGYSINHNLSIYEDLPQIITIKNHE